MKRRNFIQTAAASLGALALPGIAATTPTPTLRKPVKNGLPTPMHLLQLLRDEAMEHPELSTYVQVHKATVRGGMEPGYQGMWVGAPANLCTFVYQSKHTWDKDLSLTEIATKLDLPAELQGEEAPEPNEVALGCNVTQVTEIGDSKIHWIAGPKYLRYYYDLPEFGRFSLHIGRAWESYITPLEWLGAMSLRINGPLVDFAFDKPITNSPL